MENKRRSIFYILGGIVCIAIGVMGGRFSASASFPANRSAGNDTITMSSQQEATIAVVNLDAGVVKQDQVVYYSGKLIVYPGDNYKTTSLEEAKSGLEKGSYGAYIIIPSSFSQSVDSINHTPEKAVFEYKLSPLLSAQAREDMIYKITNFSRSISSNVSYVYLDAILSELHSVQDGAGTILGNESAEYAALTEVSAEALISQIEFSELKEQNDTVQPVDLKAQSVQLTDAMQNVNNTFRDALLRGQSEYDSVVEEHAALSQALDQMQIRMQNTNPLVDGDGNSLTEEGLNGVYEQIDRSNHRIAAQRDLLNEGVMQQINTYAAGQQTLIHEQRIQVQNDIRTVVLPQIQQEADAGIQKEKEACKEFAGAQSDALNQAIGSYVGELQAYLNAAAAEGIRTALKTGVDQQVQRVLDEQKQICMDYGSNCTQRDLLARYNQQAEEDNEQIRYLKELAGEVRAAQEQGTEADDENVQGEGDAQDTPYDDAVQLLLEEIEGLPMKELSELPEEMEEPEMKADIDMAQTDLSLVEEQLDLSRAVDGQNEPILPPVVSVTVPDLTLILTGETITYEVPEYHLPETAAIPQEELEKIERNYYIDKSGVTAAFQDGIVQVILDTNDRLQRAFEESAAGFWYAQNKYQDTLNAYDPFAYVNEEKIAGGLRDVEAGISAIETEMNEKGTEYLQYTSDVYLTTNENIQILRNDMTKANEQTAENVRQQVGSLQSLRTKNNQTNSAILEDFTKKLGFTRMGNLPYREAYEFIIDPFVYREADK
ncbi:MAG: hypothetical protein K2N01_03230 [Lachnospiraceae bacterium]|nr:hypothetical protein [Lachnospiraceae bacterium]